MKTSLNYSRSSRLHAALFLAITLGLLAVQSVFAANGTPNYLDNNGATAGFGVLSGNFGLTNNPQKWTTSSAGTTAPTSFAASAQMTFGAAAGDSTASGTYTVTANNAATNSPPATLLTTVNGIVVNSTGANVLVNWIGNMRQGAASTWTVNSGSALITTGNANNGGFNHNNQSTTFTGGGIIAFQNALCANAQSAVQTENLITQNAYGILFSNGTGIPSQWRIDDCYMPAATNAIFAPANVTLDSFVITQLKQAAGTGIACTNMQNSDLILGAVPISISGTSTSNFIVGGNGVTTGTRVKTVVVDKLTGAIHAAAFLTP